MQFKSFIQIRPSCHNHGDIISRGRICIYTQVFHLMTTDRHTLWVCSLTRIGHKSFKIFICILLHISRFQTCKYTYKYFCYHLKKYIHFSNIYFFKYIHFSNIFFKYTYFVSILTTLEEISMRKEIGEHKIQTYEAILFRPFRTCLVNILAFFRKY